MKKIDCWVQSQITVNNPISLILISHFVISSVIFNFAATSQRQQFLHSSSIGRSMSNVEEEVIQGMQSKVFSCNYCHRVFTTSQALGGHQNGHRRERELVKRAQRHAQLLANPMHHSLRLTSPYIDRRSSFVYGLESAAHQLLTVPLPLINHNPLYYQPYSLPCEYYAERRGEVRVSRFNEMRHEPTLNVGNPSSTSVNLELALFKGSNSHGDHIDGKKISATDEKKSDEVDLTLHL